MFPFPSGERYQSEQIVNGVLTPGSYVDADFFNGTTDELVNVIQAAGLVPSNATPNQVLQAIRILLAGGYHATRAATSTWTVPVGITRILVEIWGAGGGGGGNTSTTTQGGGGGGGGEFRKGMFVVTPGQSFTLTVGRGGSGGSGGAGGTAGTATSFGNLMTANGGLQGFGGSLGNGGAGGSGGAGGLLALSGYGGGLSYQVTGGYVGGTGGASYMSPQPSPNAGGDGLAGGFPGAGGNGSSRAGPGGDGAHGLIQISW